MENNNVTALQNKLTKRDTQKLVFEKLSDALSEYRGKLKEKKFENKLKKASRLFAVDIVKAIKKDRKFKLKELKANA